jgi:hypothetical protein
MLKQKKTQNDKMSLRNTESSKAQHSKHKERLVLKRE